MGQAAVDQTVVDQTAVGQTAVDQTVVDQTAVGQIDIDQEVVCQFCCSFYLYSLLNSKYFFMQRCFFFII